MSRDPLLALGARPRAARPSHAGWRTLEDPAHALHRRYFGVGKPREPRHFGWSGAGDTASAPPRNPPMLRQDRPFATRRGLRHDRLIPAPGLARRIAALVNVIADPMAFATRTARRLARIDGAIATLRGRSAPNPRALKDDKREPPALGLLGRSHDLFARPFDTS